MADIELKLPDGSKKKCKAGTTGLEIAKGIGEGLARASVAVVLDGKLLDLKRPLYKSGDFRIITEKDHEALHVLRHSAAHIMAEAVTSLFPYAKPTIGPVIEDGFYYDFDHEPFRPEDIEKIEKKMRQIIDENRDITREEIQKTADAKRLFKDNKFKLELIDEAAERKETILIYRQGDWFDLCAGPHLPSTGRIRAFKLMKLAGAYWRGDSKRPQLQRIYGTAFFDKKELKRYVEARAEAEKRDHKKIGREQGLFMINEMIGKGLPVWLPKGEIIKEEIERYAIGMERKYGYVRVSTPHLAKEELFITSGHLPHYEDDMYPKMVMDDGTYYLKAMNCPLHHLIYKNTPKSYRDLPLRIAEYGTVYRNELSGALSGLLRVRMLSMNDAHIYCSVDQIKEEIASVFRLIKEHYDLFGLKNYYFRLSLWDPDNTDKYIGSRSNWEMTQDTLRKILQDLKLPFTEASGEAAFYGPKVDIQFKTVLGREETMSTVQLDFAAAERFGLAYTDNDGKENKDVFVIHRAPLSTHERFIAFLIEHYGGKFPLWMSPVQVRILPIADRHRDFADKVRKQFFDAGIRVELDSRTETISKKVREAQIEYVNYIIVVGDKEIENKTVNVRTRDNQVHGEKKPADLLKEILDEIRKKA
ncbi:MAG: threonine--tRNA ligase [Candidatus Nanoarchaeia archaeon]